MKRPSSMISFASSSPLSRKSIDTSSSVQFDYESGTESPSNANCDVIPLKGRHLLNDPSSAINMTIQSRALQLFAFCSFMACVVTALSVGLLVVPGFKDRPGISLANELFDNGISTASSSSGPLLVRNMPKNLAWAPWYSKASALSLSVDYFSNFNPSILELSDGSHIFASRTGWLYNGKCKAYENSDDSDALYNCLKNHEHLYSEHTVIGQYDPTSSTLNVFTPDADGGTSSFNYLNGTMDWNFGAAWYDTRFIYPYNRRYSVGHADHSGKFDTTIIVTSQTTELFTEDDWFELENSKRMALQSSFIGLFDPRLIREGGGPKDGRLKRWAYYNPQAEVEELQRRRDGVSEWKLSAADIAQFQCKPRPSGFPSLPFGSYSANNSVEDLNLKSTRVDRNHRRLAAIIGDGTTVVVDKNWAPFAYQDRVLWSYDLDPHIVCENDVGLDNDLDCVFCIHRYTSNSSAILHPFREQFLGQGVNESRVHLNGATAYFVPELGGFLGIMHVVNVKKWRDPAGRPAQTRDYKHYFYITESEPPFALTRISKNEVPLHASRCISPWFASNDTVTVAFVMSTQYHPDRHGSEFVLSYGDGDRYSRTATLGISEISGLF